MVKGTKGKAGKRGADSAGVEPKPGEPVALDARMWAELDEASLVVLGLAALAGGEVPATSNLVRALRVLEMRRPTRPGKTAYYYNKDVPPLVKGLWQLGFLASWRPRGGAATLRPALVPLVLFRLGDTPLSAEAAEDAPGLPHLFKFFSPNRSLPGRARAKGRRGGAGGRSALEALHGLAMQTKSPLLGGPDLVLASLRVALALGDTAQVHNVLAEDCWSLVEQVVARQRSYAPPENVQGTLMERADPATRARMEGLLGDVLNLHEAAARLIYARVYAVPPAQKGASLDPLVVLQRAAETSNRQHPVAPYALRELARALLLRGRSQEARAVVERLSASSSKSALLAWAALVDRDADAARAHAKSALRGISHEDMSAPERMLCLVAQLTSGEGGMSATIETVAANRDGRRVFELEGVGGWLLRVDRLLATGSTTFSDASSRGYSFLAYDTSPRAGSASEVWSHFAVGLLLVLSGEEAIATRNGQRITRATFKAAARKAQRAGWTWVARQLTAMGQRAAARTSSGSPAREAPAPCLADLIHLTPPWELKLQRLEAVVARERPSAVKEPRAGRATAVATRTKRLVWVLPKEDSFRLVVEPREQSLGKRGSWSKGRKVALKRLHGADPEYPLETPEDRAVAAAIKTETYVSRGYLNTEYYLDADAALDALTQHPLVFWNGDATQPLALRKVKPRLEVTREGGRYRLRMVPRALRQGTTTRVAGPYELEIIVATAAQARLDRVLEGSLTIPADQVDRLKSVVSQAAHILEVASDVGVGGDAAAAGDEEADERPADSTPVLQLARADGGLLVRVRVRPMGPEGAAMRPGQGPQRVVSQRSGPGGYGGRRAVLATRDLAAEAARAAAVIKACPALEEGYPDADGEWLLPGVETALALLEQLGPLGDEVRLEWPHGEPLRLVGQVGAGQARLRVRGGGARADGWFTVSGQVQVDEDLALELGALVDLVSATPSRFVQLDDARYLALTVSLRRQLALLARAGQRRGKGVALHPWAAPLAEPLLDDAREAGEVQAVRAWGQHLRARRKAAQAPIEIPSTLRATLRGYQRDGFQWLARLASLGAGACLADDMGLGKTVQTLALMLTRGQAGPQLVVCPSSVGGVWLSEARRFAPTLNAVRFGPGDRKAAVEGAGPFDLVVASYGLLQSEPELLASRTWETVVLDEAQHVKNPDTQRAKAAFALRGGFRVALTGTPVENRLDELWSIFRFLVPGLLGSRRSFQQRFARPIEDAGDADARGALRELVRPLLLRRLKADVLDELPARTEVERLVEPTPREAALYEALRRRAVEALGEHADGPTAQRRVRVLAEITRLRRAACHPSLVLGGATGEANSDVVGEAAAEAAGEVPTGSKLAAFGELVDELLAGGHKALVFSQFLGHLALARRWLEARGVSYQYLDGSTPAKQRDERVRAFQGGEGDVFLISLRAGGTGLNLTAADYVVHLDPWWNPAVEDQASDRAHRMGQTQPVTIVRLVAQGTIEERVLALHRRKRRLAEDLLAGADAAAKLDLDALLVLMEV